MTVLRDYAAGIGQPALTSGLASGRDDTLLDRLGQGAYDEVVGPDGTLRAGWQGLAELAVGLTAGDLARLDVEIRRFLADDGVTYGRPGQEPGPWRLDPMPLVIPADEWAPLEVGLAQRAELLNAILVDLYGEQRLLREGVVPPEVVFGHSGFVRQVAKTPLPDLRPLLLTAADLGRGADGGWTVLADRVQAPSGVGYALENRRVISQVLPELYRKAGLHRLQPFLSALRSALHTATDVVDARVVVLTPGTHSETAYDQAYLAAALGVPLVRGSDLMVRDGCVHLRGHAALERVDVILRRVDAGWSDPLELRADSQLGVPGLSEAIRRGTVRVVNGLGAGILENPGLLPFLPAASELLLGESLRLRSLGTWWCGDKESREHVLDHLDQLSVRAIDRPVTLGNLTPRLLRDRILAEPHRFVGQEPIPLSQAPTYDGRSTGGALRPRRLTLRTFTLRYGSAYRPMVGGLASSLGANGAREGAAKDVWVLKRSPGEADQGIAEVLPLEAAQARPALVPRALDDMFWFGRYVERAEDTLRLVIVGHALAEDFQTRPWSVGGQAMDVMLAALGRLCGPVAEPGDRPGDEPGDVDRDLRAVLLDASRLGSVAQSIDALRESAQGVRDQLSLDVFRAFGSYDRAAWDLARNEHSHQISESAGRMLNAMLALHGVVSNMVRDEGWRMIRVGAYLERALQLLKLLDVAVVRRGLDVDRLVLNSMLTAAESAVTHRRRYRGNVRPRSVLDLLLLDEDNPRSLLHALGELDRHLEQLEGSTGSTRPERLLDELIEECRHVDLSVLVILGGESRPHLRSFLAATTDKLGRVADAIAAQHLQSGPAPRPLVFTAADVGP